MDTPPAAGPWATNAEGTKVLYTAEPQGYGQVNIVNVPAWDELPDRAAVKG